MGIRFGKSIFRAAPGLLIMMTVACAGVSREPSPEAVAVIESYFLNRTELDPIEGIWLRADQVYEIAVFKSSSGMSQDYAYVGVVTKHLSRTGLPYATRRRNLLSIKAVEPNAPYYQAWYHNRGGGEEQCDVYIARDHLHVWFHDSKWEFVRIYPEEEH